jgi:hypothetical protein
LRHTFTHLYAQVIQQDGGFTVNIRMLNDWECEGRAWGQEIATSIEMASEMIEQVAAQFSIPPHCISIKLVMENFKDGTRH